MRNKIGTHGKKKNEGTPYSPYGIPKKELTKYTVVLCQASTTARRRAIRKHTVWLLTWVRALRQWSYTILLAPPAAASASTLPTKSPTPPSLKVVSPRS